MHWLIADAMAQDGSAGQPSFFGLLPLILIFVVFYFLLIRPQMKRAKEHRTLVDGLSKGDEVVTSGGLLGRITEVGESFVTLELADNLRVKLQKHAVVSVVPKGTIKAS